MNNGENFDRIRPYNEAETMAALRRIVHHPLYPMVAHYMFPERSVRECREGLLSVGSIDEFQSVVMYKAVQSIIGKTTDGFEYSGAENLRGLDGKFVAITNHRDIVLDPAFLEYTLLDAGYKCSRICIGSNLLKLKVVKDMMLANQSIIVMRDANPRSLVENSRQLSSFIRRSVEQEGHSVWIAQREGRAKDGNDLTAQGVLKMLNMSGAGSFCENFASLNLVPMTYSYEYESCDARKAREIFIKKTRGGYRKGPLEDVRSIITGITQPKGRVHLNIGRPISLQELEQAASFKGNERFKELCSVLDGRISSGYRLWKTNYMAADMVAGNNTYLEQGKYTPEDRSGFEDYVASKVKDTERDIFLHIYSNPVK